MAATLAWGDGAVVSHWAAAALWRLVAFEPGPLEVTIPRECKRRGPGTAHRCRLSPSDVTRVDGISVTIPSRTLIDLAATVDVDRLEEAMDDALRRRIVTVSQMRRRLETIGRRGRPGTAAMRRVLDARDTAAPVPENVFERRLLRVFDRAGLPSPVLQHEIRDGDRPIGVVDFAFPDARLAVEADGYRWHSGRVRWDRDRVRRNRLTLLGWRVIHVTWTDLVRSPAEVADAVRKAMGT